MVAELELQHYQVKVGYLGFMNQYFICVQLISWPLIFFTVFNFAWRYSFYLGVIHFRPLVIYFVNSFGIYLKFTYEIASGRAFCRCIMLAYLLLVVICSPRPLRSRGPCAHVMQHVGVEGAWPSEPKANQKASGLLKGVWGPVAPRVASLLHRPLASCKQASSMHNAPPSAGLVCYVVM